MRNIKQFKNFENVTSKLEVGSLVKYKSKNHGMVKGEILNISDDGQVVLTKLSTLDNKKLSGTLGTGNRQIHISELSPLYETSNVDEAKKSPYDAYKAKDPFTNSSVVRANDLRFDYDKNIFKNEKGLLEKIVKLGEDIHEVLNGKGVKNIDISLFYSGYRGMHVKYTGGDVLIFDQPGKVGLEDQTMPYIKMGDIEHKPDYFSRGFGSVGMDPKMREKAYKEILEFFKNKKF